MNLEELGYNQELEKLLAYDNPESLEVGRVVSEHKERYTVCTAKGELDAEVTGNLRFTARGREDFPAVGDWVALLSYDSDFAIIHKILPRFSLIKRQAVGHFGEIQVIAANVDYAFIVQAVSNDFNINRLERYLTLCYSSGVSPIIILSKIDLVNEDVLSDLVSRVKTRIKNIPVLAISNETRSGYEKLNAIIEKGKTYCMLGSSGVGKSTLINNLSGKSIMHTSHISRSTNKGRHITSHRELIVLESGGIFIDNPGMREVGIADFDSGLEKTFDIITALGESCKFKNCTHINETGCAVLSALENGDLDQALYDNFLKMEKERAHFETTVSEKRRKEKIFGKIIRNYKKDLKKNNDSG
jgi:ribosome biogenesis GTPase / thiamine phosphate phosphatase